MSARKFHLLGSRRRGFVLLTVIGLMAVTLILLVATQSSYEYSRVLSRQIADRDERAEAAESIIAIARTAKTQWLAAGSTQPHVYASGRISSTATLRPLIEGDPLWAQMPGIHFRAGDALLAIDWGANARPPQRSNYLVNLDGSRSSAVAAPSAAATAAGNASIKSSSAAASATPAAKAGVTTTTATHQEAK